MDSEARVAAGGSSLLADFTGQVVLVTGSSSGIGEAVARAFDGLGAAVLVNSRSSVDAGQAVEDELRDGAYFQADVGVEAECKELLEFVLSRWGRLDHLINNAGTTKVIPHGDLDAATDDVWERILQTNIMGTWYLSRLAAEPLRASRGSIVNVTSLAGVRPSGSSIPYAVSKAGVNHLTRLLAKVLAPEVRVNAVAPGLIETPWTADWDAVHAAVRERAPLARSGTAEDIARACVLLAGSSYTTGEILLSDGGIHLG